MTFKRAIVTAVGPLRIKIDGDTVPIPFTPKSGIDPATLAVGDVVHADQSGHRLVVLVRVGGLGLLSGRNRIINGNFRTNQRGYASAESLAAGAYGFDRWRASNAGTTLTFIDAPQGQQVTINTDHGMNQIVWQPNLPAGDYVLSWEGTAEGRVYPIGGTPPSYAASPVTVTLDGTTDAVVTFNAPWTPKTLGRVQLEAGTVPTPFERISVGEELAACQQYYQRVASASAFVMLAFGYQQTSTSVIASLQLGRPMRTVPTVSSSNVEWSDQVTFATALTSLSLTTGSDLRSLSLESDIASNGAGFRPGVIRVTSAGSGYLTLDAEL